MDMSIPSISICSVLLLGSWGIYVNHSQVPEAKVSITPLHHIVLAGGPRCGGCAHSEEELQCGITFMDMSIPADLFLVFLRLMGEL